MPWPILPKAFSAFDLDHPESFTNISSHDKLVRYRGWGKKMKGEEIGRAHV